MKFLVMMQPVEEAVTKMQAKQAMRLIISHLEYFEDLRIQGKITESGSFAGLRGGFGILEVDSLEELNEIINLSPAMPFMETKIYPLITGEERIKQMKKLIEATEEREKILAKAAVR